MRTRALLYIVLGFLILALLLAGDLIAHSYKALEGFSFELFRAILQGVALSWLARGVYTLFFRTSSVSRAGDDNAAILWPVRLVRRSAFVLFGALISSFLPLLFTISFARHVPGTFGTVISIDIIGAVWLLVSVGVALSFWQLIFIRQHTRSARRRFAIWGSALGIFSLFSFLIQTSVVPSNTITVASLSALGLLVGVAALNLGYRLPWIPYVTKTGKRRLLAFSALNVGLSVCLLVGYTGAPIASELFGYYAVYWRMAAGGLFGTIGVYFGLVFFSALFSLSSSDLVERKSAEVKSLVKLTRFSSDVLSSELLLDLPKLAEQITALACEATGADCAWLELQSNNFPGRSTQVEEAMIRSYVRIDELSAERIMSTAEGFPEAGKSISSPRAELGETRKAFLLRKAMPGKGLMMPTGGPVDIAELHSLVAVPLIRRDEVRGGLYVAKRREDGFDDDDLTVLTAFSDVASLALETARLLADSIEKQKFDGELRAARAMQKSLLPEHFPEVPGFDIDAVSIPAYDVGGDYYDFSVMWDGAPIIVIGDVSGKGISASLYMAETKGVVQALAPLMSNMPELLEGTNSALLRNSPSHTSLRRSFVTLGLIAFHPNDGIKYCRAGHTPLLIVRASGEYEFLQPKGMAVGLMRQTLFNQMLDERTIQVGEGDILVLFSDGITDARSSDGEEYGYIRLAEIVAMHRAEANARRVTLAVLDHVSQFTSSGTFGDDATLVVMKCVKSPEKKEIVWGESDY
ncbi:MAG: GAF domain-containing SpoIIE family protein phosphatase [Candidatus Kapaibacterium sp.]|jgi:sigma-B regulation protein RsbU (phosphoserine phosphatase)